jgi:hypothetical protein
MQASLVRAGLELLGASENDPMPRAVRGWRSLRYANLEPALSLSVLMRASLPARFVTIWVLDPQEPSATRVAAGARRVSLAAGAVKLNPIGSLDPIDSVHVAARPSSSG